MILLANTATMRAAVATAARGAEELHRVQRPHPISQSGAIAGLQGCQHFAAPVPEVDVACLPVSNHLPSKALFFTGSLENLLRGRHWFEVHAILQALKPSCEAIHGLSPP